MKVRIIRQPTGTVTGISLKYYRPGEVYELPPTLADYLVAEGSRFTRCATRNAPRRWSKSSAANATRPATPSSLRKCP